MSGISSLGWNRGGWRRKSGLDIVNLGRDTNEKLDTPTSCSILLAGLAGAESLVWSYDILRARFEFKGDFEALHLPVLAGDVTFDDLGPLFDLYEIGRLEAVLSALDVHSCGDNEDDDHVRCLLRLNDQRLIYIKGQRISRTHVCGTLTHIGDDVSRMAKQVTQADGDLILHDVNHDPLTGLYNRQGFLNAARQHLLAEGDYDLVVGDLNRFRRLNEALGHERADLVLTLLAHRLRDAFGSSAVLARLGEDEFAVLTQRGFPRVSERMRNALERTITIAGFDIHPTFSMGAVSVEGGEVALDSAELLRRAEMAVDAAQSKGVGGVASYKRDLESDGLSRLAMEAELRKAFISGEIHAWYQPIVTLETGVIAGFEALARWVHPKRGVIPPDHFLAATRDLGLMADLGIIVMNSTVSLIKKWRAAYKLPEDFFISVNLSAPEIERFHLVEDVSRLIREAELPRKCLKLEVTESDVMRDPLAAARILEALRDAGAGIALDDFGTGFSSLSYLAKLPFDTLKVDRSFVSTMSDEESSEKIVRAILTLGRDLGLDVVAEGVEDTDLAKRLSDMGCALGQGYGFAKALKPAEAEAYLARSLGFDVAELTV